MSKLSLYLGCGLKILLDTIVKSSTYKNYGNTGGNTGQSCGWSPSLGFVRLEFQTPNSNIYIYIYMIKISKRAETKQKKQKKKKESKVNINQH